jgi:hypothetical protein
VENTHPLDTVDEKSAYQTVAHRRKRAGASLPRRGGRSTLSAMTRRSMFVLGLTAALLVGGCRQPDGALPPEGVEDPSRRADLTRDLLAIARGDADGRREFSDDLKVWGTTSNDVWAPGDELAARLSTALEGKMLTDEQAAQLARQFWIAAAGRELSARQVDRLGEDVKGVLTTIGATPAAAESVAQQVAAVQEAVTTKRRRWYQLF